jgi:hypothetical protein
MPPGIMHLCILLLLVGTAKSILQNCSGTTTVTRSDITCNPGTGGGEITHVNPNVTIDCNGSQLEQYGTDANVAVMQGCPTGTATFDKRIKIIIRNSVHNFTGFYSGGEVRVEGSSLGFLSLFGADEYNVTMGPRTTISGQLNCFAGVRLTLDYAGSDKVRLVIGNGGTSCLIKRFPPGSTLCIREHNCTYNGTSFIGCITTPNGTAPVVTITPSSSALVSQTQTLRHASVTDSATRSVSVTDISSVSAGARSTSNVLSPSISAPVMTRSGSHTVSATQHPHQSAARPTDTETQVYSSTLAVERHIAPAAIEPVASVPQAAQTTGAIAGTSAAILSPASASQASRIASIQAMIRCEPPSNDPPPYISYPVQDYVSRNWGNTLLIVAATNFFLQLLSAVCYCKGHANPIVKWVSPLLLCYQAPLFAENAAAHLYDGPVVWLAAALMGIALLHPSIIVLRRPPTQADAVIGGTRKLGGQDIPNDAVYSQFCDIDVALPYSALYGEYTSSLRSHSRPVIRVALVLEIWLGVVCSTFSGLRSEGSCAAYSFAILGLSACFAIYQVILSPFAPYFEKRSAQAKSVAQLALSGLACATMVVDSFEEAVSWIGLGMLVYMPIEFCIALYLDKRASRQRKKFLKDLGGPTGVPLLTHPKDASALTVPAAPESPENAPFVRANPLLQK